MTRTIDCFIAHDDERELLALVGAAVGHPPTPSGAGRWDVHLADDVVGHLERRDVTDVAGPAFTRLPWDLRVTVEQDGSLLDHAAAVSLRSVADDLRAGGVRVLIVHDLQHRRPAPGAGAPPATA